MESQRTVWLPALVQRTIFEGAHFLDVSAAVGPLDERHADDDSDDHAGGGDGEPERDSLLPAIGLE